LRRDGAGASETLLAVDAREQPAAPETGYLRFGTNTAPSGSTIGINSRYLTPPTAKPWLPVMGEFHLSRFPNRFLEEELLKMKAAGVSIVSTYIFWNHHEEHRAIRVERRPRSAPVRDAMRQARVQV